MAINFPGKEPTPYEKVEERFKLYACELENCSDPHDVRSLKDSLDVLLDRAVKIGLIATQELEPKIYQMTFAGRDKGEVRKIW